MRKLFHYNDRFRFRVHQFILLKNILLIIFSIAMVKTGIRLYTIGAIEKYILIGSSFVYLVIFIRLWLNKSSISNRILGTIFLFELALFMSDYWIVYLNTSAETFAIYKFGAREIPLIFIFGYLASNEIVKRITVQNQHSPMAELSSEFYRLNFRFFPLAMLFMLLSHFIVEHQFSGIFQVSASLANSYLLLLIPRMLFPEIILKTRVNFESNWRIYFFQFALNIGLSFWWLKVFGLKGVAYATVFSVFVTQLILVFKLKREKIALSMFLPTKQYLLFSVLLLSTFIIVEFLMYK